MKRTLDLDNLISPDAMASAIANSWQTWNQYRKTWMSQCQELRNYVYATDTLTTQNQKLPWSNSTTTPKLTQIYDNLKANYTSALFPSSDWMKWKGDTVESRDKSRAITEFMKTKMDQSGFTSTTMDLLDDWILTGNCFGTIEYINEFVQTEDGNSSQVYKGPRLVRISPFDITFDPTAAHFSDTPKIIRSLKRLGEVQKMAESDPDFAVILNKMLNNRSEVGGGSDIQKSDAYIADGFTSIQNYYASSSVEFLTFYGDMYDQSTQTLYTNKVITVVDRAYIVKMEDSPSYMGTDMIFHAGWRTRPDNLYAMGPLDNLVGMQYRIDHLENLKADVFDQIALPMVVVQGDVEDFENQPGERIYVGEEGAVSYLRPDATALQADFQIQTLETKMEELAGAPRMAMGLRTPGEKTAFEVGVLDNGANRIFQHKALQFELMFLQPVLQAMLEVGYRNFSGSEIVSGYDAEVGSVIYTTITKDDIGVSGKIQPEGSSHFEKRNRRVQTLTQLIQLKADPSVGSHISGKRVAAILADELDEPELYGDNIAVIEGAETQKAMLDAEADVQEDMAMKAEMGL